MTRYAKIALTFLAGIIALVLSSYTRTFKSESTQFITISVFFFICGWLLKKITKKIWPFSIVFIIPTALILMYAYFIMHWGSFHYLGEFLMIVPSYILGIHIHQWKTKKAIASFIALLIFYTIYILKINPELDYYNNSVKRKDLIQNALNATPNFSFLNPDKSVTDLNTYRGKVVLIDFYFNNCYQCRIKHPELLKLKDRFKGNDNVVFLEIHRGGNESFTDFIDGLKHHPKELNYVYDSGSVASKYLGINGYPHEIILDKRGYIKSQFSGFSKTSAIVYEKNTYKKIQSLLNE